MVQSFDSAKLASKLRFSPDYVFSEKDSTPLFGLADIELSGEVELRNTRVNRGLEIVQEEHGGDSMPDIAEE